VNKPILYKPEIIKQDIVDFIKSNYNGNIFSLKKGWVRLNDIVKYITEKYKISRKMVMVYLSEIMEENKLIPVIRTKYFDGGRYYAPAGFPIYFTTGLFGTIAIVILMTALNKLSNYRLGIYPLFSALFTLWACCVVWAISKKYE